MNKILNVIKKDRDTEARLGILSLPHGDVETPAFMPVGTNGTVKGIYHDRIKEMGYGIILGNTYHLYLRPGTEVLSDFGGLHKFSNWDRNILTDSGGFQVFSLSGLRKIKENGVTFQSHIDGSKHIFTPEKVVDIQQVIGSDIAMCLDVCTPPGIDYKAAAEAMKITHRWAERALKEKERLAESFPGNLFGIVQGNFYEDLRKESAETISGMDFPGVAIGGLSVGEPTEQMYEMLEVVCPILPDDRPRYLMGVGTPANILEGIARGVDMFDCVMPTRNGRNGMLFTWDGIMNMKNQKWADDFSPLDPKGTSFVDRTYSKAYLRHLFIAKEIFAGQIASEHNLAFYLDLVREARKHIKAGDFRAWKDAVVPRLMTRL